MKALLIAEKPSLMREIQGVYNKNKNRIGMDIDFLAQAGHLVGLKLPKEIDEQKYGKWDITEMPQEYPYEYKILEGKRELVGKIRSAIKSGAYDRVIHAGDPDGEGELLVRLVLAYVGNTLPVVRFWSNDLTEGAILKALTNMEDDSNYDHIYEAALVRQKADYQFGMNVTGIATLKMGTLCKLGRVKAPIISMIVEREREIRNYVEKKTYKPSFTYRDCEFVYDKAFEKEEEAIAFNVPATQAIVSEFKQERKEKKAPKLFKLSTLQTEAHKALKMSGAETLATLQSLYESKATSYPRTDCEYISSAVDIGGIRDKIIGNFSDSSSYLKRSASDVLKDKSYANDKAIASEEHTAIIPTGEGLSKSASEKEKRLYELICRRFLAMFSEPKVTMSTKVTAIPCGSEYPYVFTETEDISGGFEYVLNPKYNAKKGKGVSFSRGMLLDPIAMGVKECVSNPPSRYNDGSIIAALDKPEAFEGEEGKVKFKIGTPATRANIIEECKNNGYFTVEKGLYYATEKAEAVIDSFPGISLFNPVESGRWEDIFNHIRNGQKPEQDAYKELMEAMFYTSDEMKNASVTKISKSGNSLGVCPKCGGNVLFGKYGAYCSSKCGMSLGKYMGHSLTESQIASLLQGKKVLLKGLKSKSGNKYDIYIKPEAVESFSYKRTDGSTANGFQWKFATEFPSKK